MRFKNKLSIVCHILESHILKKRIPLNVSLSVTNRCNLRCTYCGYHRRSQVEIPTKQILSLIGELSDMGTQRLGFWGGEPLLRKDIGQFIRGCEEVGIFSTLISNGYLVPQRIDELKKLGLLLLSLDGPEKVNDVIKGRGCYARVIKAIRVALAKGIPVWTITVLTKENISYVDFVLDRAERMGFLATFQLLYFDSETTGSGNAMAGMIPSRVECEKVIRKLLSEKRKGAPIASSEAYLKHILSWIDYGKTAMRDADKKCWGGVLFCNIDTNGAVYPCDWMIGKIGAQSFVRSGFREAWERMEIPHNCTCLKSCYSEYNLIFSLNPNAAINAFKKL
jgi:MoaA/NifB/PqqE/SkfB family radical SAM enzyme